MRVLGIETSCDETGIAVYDSEKGLMAHIVYSQIALHADYGGVVPELASRDHIRKTLPLIKETLAQGNIDVESIAALENLADTTTNCIPMMGLHPTYVKANWQQELATIEKQLFAAPARYCAVGEIGLDLYWDDTFLDAQKEVFRIQVQWAKKLQLPIAIHVRKAFEELFVIFT